MNIVSLKFNKTFSLETINDDYSEELRWNDRYNESSFSSNTEVMYPLIHLLIPLSSSKYTVPAIFLMLQFLIM